MSARVGLATTNPGKVREIARIVAGAGIDLVAPPPDWLSPPEDAPDYLSNALAKARSLAARTGLPALADDSGIEVDVLGGAPGPRSARHAGEGASDEENLRALVAAVAPTSPAERTARYRCVAVLVVPGGDERVAEGIVEGTLIVEPRGTGGFGYDPIFVPEGETRTMAELTPGDKETISHRGRAFRGLIPALEGLEG